MPSNPDMEIACVHPGLLGAMWPHCGPLLLRGALETTKGDMQAALHDLLKHVLAAHEGKSQVWVVIDNRDRRVLAAMVTEIIADGVGTPGRHARKVVWVSRMAGERILSWGKALSDKMADYAKAEGAAAVKFTGRKGLARAYSNLTLLGALDDGTHFYERAVA